MSQPKPGHHFEVVWDYCHTLDSKEDEMNHFLNHGFEPFAIVPIPRLGLTTKPGELNNIDYKVFFKKPNMVERPDAPAATPEMSNSEIPTTI